MGFRILIVDDEPQVCEMLGTHLSQAGHDVVTAGNGKEAIKRLNEEAFDLIICDIIMPEQDGLEVLLHVRRHRPNTKLLAISVPGNELLLQSAKGLGAWRILSKPFTMEQITKAVDQAASGAEDCHPILSDT